MRLRWIPWNKKITWNEEKRNKPTFISSEEYGVDENAQSYFHEMYLIKEEKKIVFKV